MGTYFEIWLDAPDKERAQELFEAAFEEIDRIDATLSTYKDTSEISRINRRAPGEAVTTDPETFGILRRSMALSARTGGAFDVTVGRLTRAWGFFRREGRLPSRTELETALADTGWRHVELDTARRTVAFRRSGILLDLGAVGKGYALDRVAALLRGFGVTAALLGAGRSTHVAVGSPPDADWRINVPDPVDRSRTITSLDVRDAALSTSGSYEKFFVVDGTRYCHIFDPRTGMPVSGMLQATVTAGSGEDSDALSTAAFVAGPAATRAIVEGAAGSAAMLVAGDARDRETIGIRWPGHRAGGPRESERAP